MSIHADISITSARMHESDNSNTSRRPSLTEAVPQSLAAPEHSNPVQPEESQIPGPSLAASELCAVDSMLARLLSIEEKSASEAALGGAPTPADPAQQQLQKEESTMVLNNSKSGVTHSFISGNSILQALLSDDY
jgi:hypothetical protein